MESLLKLIDQNRDVFTYTLISLDPSRRTKVRLPTISEGYTKSSKIASCTAVRVRLMNK